MAKTTLRQLKEMIQKLEEEHGESLLDLPVGYVENDDYWGTLFTGIQEVSVAIHSVDGPKEAGKKSILIR